MADAGGFDTFVMTPEHEKYLDKLWKHRSDAILEFGFNEQLFAPLVEKNRGLQSLHARASQNPGSRATLLLKIRHFYRNASAQFRNNALVFPYAVQKVLGVLQNGDSGMAENYLALVILKESLELPDEIVPNIEEFETALAEPASCQPMPEGRNDILPIVCALGRLQIFRAKQSETHADMIEMAKLAGELEVNSPTGFAAFEDSVIRPWLSARRELNRSWLDLRKSLTRVDRPGPMADFENLSPASGRKISEEKLEELRGILTNLLLDTLPKKFDPDALLAEVAALVPPLSAHDFDLVREEVAAIANGERNIDDCWTTACLLPACRGEVSITYDMLDNIAEQLNCECMFSHSLVRKLIKGQIRQSATTQNDETANEEAASEGEDPLADHAEESPPPFEPGGAPAVGPTDEPGAEDMAPVSDPETAPEVEPDVTNPEEEEPCSPAPAPRLADGPEVEVSAPEPEMAPADAEEEGEGEYAGAVAVSVLIAPESEIDPAELDEDGEEDADFAEEAEMDSRSAGPKPGFDHQNFEPANPNILFSPEDRQQLGELGNLAGVFGLSNPAPHPAKTASSKKRQNPVKMRRDERARQIADYISNLGEAAMAPGVPPTALVEKVYRRLLAEEDTAGLYWLAKSLGDAAPLPTWLAELVHHGVHMASSGSGSALAPLLHQANTLGHELTDGQALLLLAGLLRPALLNPVGDIVAILHTLSNRLEVFGVSSLVSQLQKFIAQNHPMTESVFTGRTPAELREGQLKRLQEKTRTFQRRMETPRYKYAPASAVVRKMFKKNGELGSRLEKCLNGDTGDLSTFVPWLRNRDNQETLIKANARPGFTKTIEARVRTRLGEDLDECADLLEEWHAHATAANQIPDSSFEEKIFGEITTPVVSDMLDRQPEGKFLILQQQRLKAHHVYPDSPEVGLQEWPFRVACAIPGYGHAGTALSLCDIVDRGWHADEDKQRAALALRILHGHLDGPAHLLQARPELKETVPTLADLRQMCPDWPLDSDTSLEELFKDAEAGWNDYFIRQCDALESAISDRYFRGAINFDQQSLFNASLAAIREEYASSMDRAAGIRPIRDIMAQLEQEEQAAGEEVEKRLDKIGEESPTEETLRIVREIRTTTGQNHSFRNAWDNIAALEDYLLGNGSLPRLKTPWVLPTTATKDFYASLKAGTIPELHEKTATWRAGRDVRKNDMTAFFRVFSSLLRQLGFDLAQDQKAASFRTSGAPYYWRTMEYYDTRIRSPLPRWGSEANGHHKFAIAWGALTPAEINRHMMVPGQYKQTDAVTMICFCPLNHADREKLLEMAPDWPTTPLIIDSNLFNYIIASDKDDKVKLLFDIALAGSCYNPYVPEAAGSVPPEMFKGRKLEKRLVTSPSEACLIYGGRQLGKSALLLQLVRDLKADPSTKVFHIILGEMDSSLLDALLKKCIRDKLVPGTTSTATLGERLLEWLNANPTIRMFVFLDESDNAIEQDKENNFREVEILRNLMQESDRRFKVVLTGLHSVQRFSHFPNSPLYHFGNPLCIGPLDREAAYELMTAPLATLGIEFESMELAQMALTYCNYHPRLIQMFCQELFEAIRKNRPHQYFISIDKAMVQNIYKSSKLNQKIKECFSMTLALDKRYSVIAYAMALGGDKGMSLDELWEDLRAWWPGAFEDSDLPTIQSLMSEMEGLGLIISLGGSWRLRTPNIVELFGGRDAIVREVAQYADMEYIKPDDPNLLRMEGASMFVATQYNLLADKSSRIYWIPGDETLGLSDVPGALAHIAAEKNNEAGKSLVLFNPVADNAQDALRKVREQWEKMKDCGLMVWLSSRDAPWIGDFIEKSAIWIERLRDQNKFVKIVCLLYPEEFHQFIREGKHQKYASFELPLSPWSLASMENYCNSRHLPPNRARDIHEKTAGWPILVDALFRGAPVDFGLVHAKLARLSESIPALAPVIDGVRTLAEYESCTEADLIDLLRNDDVKDVESLKGAIFFLERLGILRKKGEKLTVDAVATRDSVEMA